jgi:hypothetical protein
LVENEKGGVWRGRIYPRPPKGFGKGPYQEADRGSNGREALGRRVRPLPYAAIIASLPHTFLHARGLNASAAVVASIVFGRARRPGGFGGSGPPGAILSAGCVSRVRCLGPMPQRGNVIILLAWDASAANVVGQAADDRRRRRQGVPRPGTWRDRYRPTRASTGCSRRWPSDATHGR